MLFSTVLMWLLIAIGFMVALPALWLLSRGLWPAAAARQAEAASRGLFLCFLLGLIPMIGGTVTIVVLSRLPKMGAVAVLLGGVLLAWGFLGAGGIAHLVGERLWQKAEFWRQTMRGGVVLISCSLLPVVGWFVLLPLLAIIGAGVNIMSLFVRRAEPLPAVPPPLAASQAATFSTDSAAA